MTDVSVVIVCMNRPDNLYPCLESLRRHSSPGLEVETFVVAYLFDKQKLGQAKADFPWVRFIESDEIRGFAENNNLALRQADSRYCFILNDDTELSEDVIGRLVADMENLPEDAAIVCPRLVNADGSLQLCGRPEFTATKYVLQQFHLYSEPIDTALSYNPDVQTGAYKSSGHSGRMVRTCSISGAAFLIKTELFRRLGWFDERYFFTPEDMALARLARVEGYSVWVDPEVSVTHKWHATASAMMSATRPAAVRGSLIYFSEWRRPCLPQEARIGDGDSCRRGCPGSIGRTVRYGILGIAVWTAEMAKRIKAALRYAADKSGDNYIKLLTFRNITHSIFTRRSPREIFVKHYLELREWQRRNKR